MWYGIAETEDNYQVAFYSLFDTSNQFSEWKTLQKKRALQPENYQDIKDLSWFSNNYYSVEKLDDNFYIYQDLRYPLVKTKKGYKPVFSFIKF